MEGGAAERRRNRKIEFLHTRREAVIPARDARLDAKNKIALLMCEERQAAGRKSGDNDS
jgi:hypothetical protein